VTTIPSPLPLPLPNTPTPTHRHHRRRATDLPRRLRTRHRLAHLALSSAASLARTRRPRQQRSLLDGASARGFGRAGVVHAYRVEGFVFVVAVGALQIDAG